MLTTAEHLYPLSRDEWRKLQAAGHHVKHWPSSMAEWAIVRYWPVGVAFVPPQGDVHPTTVAHAEVYLSQWIVRCPAPGCGGVQLACATDRRFLCVACLNMGSDGRWVYVVWPDERDDIEEVLERRMPGNRHWLPGEPLANLVAENIAHGLGGVAA